MDNVPEPLQPPLIPIFNGADWQMSHGERAALEGVLSQVRPKLAVEIGTADGGSLRRIALHSERVHSFDLTAPARDIAYRPNVTLHTGDSHVLLPAWLEELRRPIQFALVDGDHSAEGVRDDLQALLDSRWCNRTVILAHDAENGEVREGIECALVGRDVYQDLNFTAGYVFARGGFAGQRWGGLALIVTGVAGTAQSLYR